MKNSRCDHRASRPMNKPAYWGRCLVGMLGMLCLAVQPGLTWGAEAPYLTLFRPGNIPVALDLHGSAVVGKRLYVFGGKKANVWNKEAWSGEIQPNTTITDWRVEESLPEFRTHISDLTQVVENRIYIVGGLVVADEVVGNTNIHTSKEVLWTRVKPDGHLEPWQRSPGISESPTFNGAAVATDRDCICLAAV